MDGVFLLLFVHKKKNLPSSCLDRPSLDGNLPRGLRWMNRMTSTSTMILPSTAPASGARNLWSTPEGEGADQGAPEVADAAEDDRT